MFNFDTVSYLHNVKETPDEYYRGMIQAIILDQWTNTTQLYTIKEQKALPFENIYEEVEAWVNTVSEDLINYSKVYSDFVEILFKNINHKQNYKGQYYKINLDGEHEETYICYDRMNKLTTVSEFKCVRCNNVLTWLDKNGNVVQIPCYLGTDISSTNNLINKDGIVPNTRLIILVQANEYTKSIIKNQRFLFEHSTAFKVEEVNNYMQEQGTEGEVTCVKIYIDYSAILPEDNIELNVCDYYKTNYNLTIDQGNDIIQSKDFEGKLTATLLLNEIVVDNPLKWISKNEKVVTINDLGEYKIIGEDGTSAKIICCMKDNENINAEIEIQVDSSYTPTKKIVVSPFINILDEDESIEFSAKVYKEGEIIEGEILCTPSGVSDKYYILEKTEEDNFILTNIHKSNEPLVLTFSSEDCEDFVMEIILNGLL